MIKKPKSKKKIDVRAEINDQLILAIESGVLPWRKPWVCDPNAGTPCNFDSGKDYRGANVILCDFKAMVKGYDSKFWGTFKQWKAKKFSVKKGEKSTKIIYWNWKKEEDDEGNTTSRYGFMKTYSVFNAHQVEGEGVKNYLVNPNSTRSKQEWTDDVLAESVIDATGCEVKHAGNQAFYMHSDRSVTMPPKPQFECGADYYSTLFHELGHWSEYKTGFSKLDRESRLYALAELYAELVGCYVCRSLGVPNDVDNSATYLAGWLENLKAKPGLIISVSQWASKGADCILGNEFAKAEFIKHREIVKAT